MFVIKLKDTSYYLAPMHRGIFGYTANVSKALKMKSFEIAEIVNTPYKGEIIGL